MVLDVVAKVEDERVECSVIRVRRLEVVLALDDRDFEARRQIDVLQQQTSKRPQWAILLLLRYVIIINCGWTS